MKRIFTSESVTMGHPDKICDIISDSVLDAYLKEDRYSRVACETICKSNYVSVFGEISSSATLDIESIARKAICEIGYRGDTFGFNGETCNFDIHIENQSEDIALGVDDSLETKESDVKEIGAGDQGMMFGYACNETDTLMPLPIYLAHALTKRLDEARLDAEIDYLGPDGKAQVSVEYADGKPARIDTIVVSAQHLESIFLSDLKKDIYEKVILKVIPESLIDENTKYFINPTGRFVIGGPVGDSGLTGRKIIVDTYGGMGRHGGGAFSGKDPTKVDRSAAYAARRAAKSVVYSGLAEKCEIQLAYAIGVANPVSVLAETFATGKIPDREIADLICKNFDFRPSSIIEELKLREPIYKNLASYGHMGREDLGVMWEKPILLK